MLRADEPVEVVGLSPTAESAATDLETFGKVLDSAQSGDDAAVLLRGVKRDQVQRSQVLTAPGSVRPHSVFKARMYALTRVGRPAHAVRGGLSPQFSFHTNDVSGGVDLGDRDLVMPGDTLDTVTVTLGKPVAL